MSLRIIFPLLWVAWALSWFGSAWWSNRTQKRLGMRREVRYRVVLGIGGVLFAIPARRFDEWGRFWHVDRTLAWVCLGVMVLGFAFCWWARIHLGRLWSGSITLKEGHRVVDTGPYGMVRHPIYTGILAAVLGTVVAKGTAVGIVGAALITTGLWMKARLEERWLRSELGDGYDEYRKRVPMLVPFGPKG